MSNVLKDSGKSIRRIIDFFYPPFRKFMTIQFFRYGITGSVNLVFDWVLYFFIYNFVLRHKMLELGFVTLSSHIAALVFKVPIVLLSGFLLQKYVTFSSSSLNGRVQLFRYSIVFFANLCISYFGMKLLGRSFQPLSLTLQYPSFHFDRFHQLFLPETLYVQKLKCCGTEGFTGFPSIARRRSDFGNPQHGNRVTIPRLRVVCQS